MLMWHEGVHVDGTVLAVLEVGTNTVHADKIAQHGYVACVFVHSCVHVTLQPC